MTSGARYTDWALMVVANNGVRGISVWCFEVGQGAVEFLLYCEETDTVSNVRVWRSMDDTDRM